MTEKPHKTAKKPAKKPAIKSAAVAAVPAKRYHSERTKHVRKVVDLLGGVAETAKTFRESQQNINNWISRGVVPTNSLLDVISVFVKRGIDPKAKATAPVAAAK